MKKSVTFLLALIFAAAIPLTAFAGANSHQYTDKKTGTTFIVPAGWKSADTTDTGYKSDFCFVYEKSLKKYKSKKTKRKPIYICYTSKDIFPSSEKSGQKAERKDIDISKYSIKDAADFFNTDSKNIAKAEYSGTDYYRFETNAKNFTSAFEDNRKAICYVTVKNGYMYEIIYFGKDTNRSYEDYSTLMSSIKIENKSFPGEKKDNSKLKTVICFAAVIIAAAGFIIVIIKSKN